MKKSINDIGNSVAGMGVIDMDPQVFDLHIVKA